jgi:hypothetical protein
VSDELHFQGSICGDGPYNLVNTLRFYLVDDGTSYGEQTPHQKGMVTLPVVVPLIMKGMSETHPAMAPYKYEDFLSQQLLDTGVLNWNDDGHNDGCVAFSFSSCGSDDDDNFQSYKLDVSLKIDQAGKMTSEECQAMIMQAAQQSTVANYPSDNAAEIGAGMTASALAEGLKKEAAKFGDAVFTYTLKVTNKILVHRLSPTTLHTMTTIGKFLTTRTNHINANNKKV